MLMCSSFPTRYELAATSPSGQRLPRLYRRLHRPATLVLSPCLDRSGAGPDEERGGETMKRILVLVAVAAAATAVGVSAAQAKVVVNETTSVHYSGYVPCANGGAGELVTGTI